MAENLVEGWTEPIRHQLLNDGSPFVATGMTVALVLHDKNGRVVTLAGAASWSDEATSIAQFLPASTDLFAALSPYEARWKLTASGKDSFYPNGRADVWTVRT